MASNQIKGITIEIGGDTTTLGTALDSAERQSRALASELRNIDRALQADPENAELLQQQYDALGEAVEAARQKLATLQNAQEQVQRQFNNGDITAAQYRAFEREIMNAEAAVQSLTQRQRDLQSASSGAANGVGDTAEQLSEMADNADDAGNGIEDLSALTVAKGQLMADAIKKVASELINIADNTRELREDLAKLDNNATLSGKNIDTMREALKNLNAITGETDSNIEALSNLMQTGLTENQMLQALNDLSGAVIAFPDTLKIESLADGLQETLATGAGAGAFAELMERSGKNIDDFNAGLEKAMETGTQYDYVLQQLADTGLSRINRAYRDNNQVLIEAKNAQFEIEQATARVGAVAEETITNVKGDLANLVSDNIDEIEGAIRTVGTVVSNVTEIVSEHKDVILASATAYATFVGVLKTAEGISGLITAMQALTTASEGAAVAQGLLNTVMSANPYVLAAAAIAALAAGIAVYASNVDSVDNAIKDVTKSTEELNAQIEANNAKTEGDVEKVKLLHATYETLRQKYEETGEGLDELKQITQELQDLSPTTINFIDQETGKYKDLSVEIGNVVEQLYRKRAIENADDTWENAVDNVEKLRKAVDDAQAAYDKAEQNATGYHGAIEEWILKYRAGKLREAVDAYTKAAEDLTAAEKNLIQVHGGTGIPDNTESVEYTVGINAQAYEDAAKRDAQNYRASIIKADNVKKAEYNKFKNEYAKLKYTYDTADIQDDKWFYGELERLLQEYGDESIEEYQTYYAQLAGYKRKQREKDIAAEKEMTAAQKASYQSFLTEYNKLKYDYDTAEVQDKDAFYAQLGKLLQKYGDESLKEYQSYYIDLAAYQRDKQAEINKNYIEASKERLDTIKEEVKNVKSEYDNNYKDLLQQRTNYEKTLSSLSQVYKEGKQKDRYGKEKDVFELLDLEAGNKEIEKFDNTIAALEKRGMGKGLSNYVLSLSAEQSEKMITALNSMSDKELAAYSKSFDKRNELIKERSEKRFAPMFEELNKTYLTQMSTIFEGVSDEAKDFGAETVDGFIAGFGGNADAAVAAVSSWADGIIKTIQDKLNSGVASLDEQITQTLAKTDISMGGTTQISADIVPGNINVPTNAEVKQSVTEQVTVTPDMTELNDFYDKFAAKIGELKIDIEDMAIDLQVKGVITDAVENKIVDLIADKIGIRSMMSGKEAWSY